METITQLQETDLLSAPLLVWRRERMEGEVNHRFSRKQSNRVARGLWSTPIPGGFMVVSANEEVCSVSKWKQ